MIIKEQDIINMYKNLGRETDYYFANKYLEFKSNYKNNVRQVANKIGIHPYTASRWLNSKRTPYPIKVIHELKQRNLLPFSSSPKIARLVGLLHGDGFLYNYVQGFGVTNNELVFIKKAKQEIFGIFNIDCKIRKIRDKGDIETIHGKKFIVKNPTYQIRYNSKPLGILLFLIGVPKGIKTNQKYSVPKWIMKGNKEVQKAFLHGLFDSKFSNASISTYGSHKNNLSNPRMEMAKSKEFRKNLFDYLSQIQQLLENFRIVSKIKYSRNYSDKKMSLTLVLSNQLKNILTFIDKVGFYYSDKKKAEANKLRELIYQKIKDKNKIYRVLEYCNGKKRIVLKDLEKDLGIAESTTFFLGKYLHQYEFAERLREGKKLSTFIINQDKVKEILNNKKLLFNLPSLESIR